MASAGEGSGDASPRRGAVRRPAHIFYGESHTLSIEGFRSLVGRRHTIVASVRDGLELVNTALRLKPEVVALAISVPLLNGVEAARVIKNKRHGVGTDLSSRIGLGQ